MRSFFRRYIGSKEFYKLLLAIALPIIVQNAISNFVNLLDNIMVGRIGTEQMSGVAITNELIFVFNLAIFGAVSGAGLFSSQFFGARNDEGVRHAFRFKLYTSVLVSALFLLAFLIFGRPLVSLYLNESSDPVREAETLAYALDYLRIMCVGLIPYAVTMSYATTLREGGETAVPMYASLAAVSVNLVFNYLWIYGHLGFPAMGVRGAALATVFSRFVEVVILIVYAHTHAHKHSFVRGLYASLRIPLNLVGKIAVKTLPLLCNEILWALSFAFLNQIYSLRGLDVVAAINISSTVYNTFSVACLSIGSVCAILIGRRLGANEIEEARADVRRLIAFALAIGVFFALLLLALGGVIPMIYNTGSSIRALAAFCIRISACVMPVHAFSNCSYFILRSGGKVFVTMLFDSFFCWVVYIPIALLMTYFTGADIRLIYFCVTFSDVLKMLFGYILLRKGIWINNMVSGDMEAQA